MRKTATDGFSTQPHSSNSALPLIQSLFRTWALWISDCGSNSSRGGNVMLPDGDSIYARGRRDSCGGLRRCAVISDTCTVGSLRLIGAVLSHFPSSFRYNTNIIPQSHPQPRHLSAALQASPANPEVLCVSEQRELAGNRPISTHDRLILAAHPMGVQWAETDLSINQRPENTPSWHLDAALLHM